MGAGNSKVVAVLFLALVLLFLAALLVDLDSDGLANYKELLYFTDPFSADTDGDGLDDAYEVKIGSDPRTSWKLGLSSQSVIAALSLRYRASIHALASSLAAGDKVGTVWNVLKWVDENMEYDEAKAASPAPPLDDPATTIARGRGLCGDYALATAALLLESGFSEVYVLVLDLKGSKQGHAATAVKLGGELYVLDQHLPPMRLQSYIPFVEAKFGSKVTSIKAIKVSRRADGEVSAEMLELKPPPPPPPPRSALLEEIRAAIAGRLRKVVREDRRLRDLALKELDRLLKGVKHELKLPPGYFEGESYALSLPAYYVSDLFLDKLLDEFVLENLLEEATGYDAFWVEVAYSPSWRFKGEIGEFKAPALLFVAVLAKR